MEFQRHGLTRQQHRAMEKTLVPELAKNDLSWLFFCNINDDMQQKPFRRQLDPYAGTFVKNFESFLERYTRPETTTRLDILYILMGGLLTLPTTRMFDRMSEKVMYFSRVDEVLYVYTAHLPNIENYPPFVRTFVLNMREDRTFPGFKKQSLTNVFSSFKRVVPKLTPKIFRAGFDKIVHVSLGRPDGSGSDNKYTVETFSGRKRVRLGDKSPLKVFCERQSFEPFSTNLEPIPSTSERRDIHETMVMTRPKTLEMNIFLLAAKKEVDIVKEAGRVIAQEINQIFKENIASLNLEPTEHNLANFHFGALACNFPETYALGVEKVGNGIWLTSRLGAASYKYETFPVRMDFFDNDAKPVPVDDNIIFMPSSMASHEKREVIQCKNYIQHGDTTQISVETGSVQVVPDSTLMTGLMQAASCVPLYDVMTIPNEVRITNVESLEEAMRLIKPSEDVQKIKALAKDLFLRKVSQANDILRDENFVKNFDDFILGQVYAYVSQNPNMVAGTIDMPDHPGLSSLIIQEVNKLDNSGVIFIFQKPTDHQKFTDFTSAQRHILEHTNINRGLFFLANLELSDSVSVRAHFETEDNLKLLEVPAIPYQASPKQFKKINFERTLFFDPINPGSPEVSAKDLYDGLKMVALKDIEILVQGALIDNINSVILDPRDTSSFILTDKSSSTKPKYIKTNLGAINVEALETVEERIKFKAFRQPSKQDVVLMTVSSEEIQLKQNLLDPQKRPANSERIGSLSRCVKRLKFRDKRDLTGFEVYNEFLDDVEHRETFETLDEIKSKIKGTTGDRILKGSEVIDEKLFQLKSLLESSSETTKTNTILVDIFQVHVMNLQPVTKNTSTTIVTVEKISHPDQEIEFKTLTDPKTWRMNQTLLVSTGYTETQEPGDTVALLNYYDHRNLFDRLKIRDGTSGRLVEFSKIFNGDQEESIEEFNMEATNQVAVDLEPFEDDD